MSAAIADGRHAWMDHAACASRAEVFLSTEDLPRAEAKELERRAKRICRTCPVVATCLEHALDVDGHGGIWGGLTPTERRRLRRQRSKARR